MIVIFDTETSGLPKWDLPSDDPAQPHLVQFAALIYDGAGREISSIDVLVRPDGWEMDDDALALHGITTDHARKFGVSEARAAEIYFELASKADLVVAHSVAFDKRMMRIAMIRAGLNREWLDALGSRPSYCTMQGARPFVPQIKPKAPKLAECMRHFFDADLENAHNAMVDARACARVYWHLQTMEKSQ